MFGQFLITTKYLAFTVCNFKSYLILLNSDSNFLYLLFNKKIITAILL